MEDFTLITSSDNDRIKLYKRLAADKKARKKEGLFTVEGARLVSDAASEAAQLCCVFFTKDAFEKYGDTMELLTNTFDRKIFFMITEELAKSLSQTQVSQGIFALCRMKALDKSEVYDKIKHGGRYLILDNIQDPGNLGTMLRTADACGIDAVVVCNCCDIYNPKTVRSAMGSIMRVSFVCDSFEEAVLRFKAAGITVYASVIDSDALSLSCADFSGGAAVIIGNEGSGIPPEHVLMADERLTIRMHGTINSLNAAMAAGIIMWELVK